MKAQQLFLIFLLFTVVHLFSTSALGEDGILSVTVKSGPYDIQQTDQGHEVFVEGFGHHLVLGKPKLPGRIFSAAIPPGAEFKGITFETGEGILLPGQYDILPVPVSRMECEDQDFIYENDEISFDQNYKEVYSNDKPYPQTQGQFMRTAGFRKYNLVDFCFTPFAYCPQSGRLIYYPSLTAHISYDLPQNIPEGTVLDDFSQRMEKFAREIVCNYDQAKSWYPPPNLSKGRTVYDYVIITLDHLIPAVQPLVDWEEAKGRNVKVVTNLWINDNYPGYDLAERIRNFLREKYPSGKWGIEEVVLVGHYNDLPIRKCEASNWTAKDFKAKTDYYYAELSLPDSESWDDDGDHLWAEDEDDSFDFCNEVIVARIPWNEYTTVENICTKSVTFENNNDLFYKHNILFLSAFLDSTTECAVLAEYIIQNCQPWMPNWSKTRIYENNVDYPTSFPNLIDYPLLNANVMDVWPNNKFSFVSWGGHGWFNKTRILKKSPYHYFINSSNCTELDDTHPAIIFACACLNSEPINGNIGQEMLKQGSVGFLGATAPSKYCVAWDDESDGDIQTLNCYFTHKVTSETFTQGEAHQRSLWDMYSRRRWTSHKEFQTLEWGCLMGNPDLGIPAKSALCLTFPEGLPEGFLPPGPETEIIVEITPVLEQYVYGSACMYYRYNPNHPWTMGILTNLGGNLYKAVLPNISPGSRPEFYFCALGDGNTTVLSPHDAPNNVYSFDVCFQEIIMDDDFETDQGWTIHNQNILYGGWELADPASNSYYLDDILAQPGFDHSLDGTLCFVTGAIHEVIGGPTTLTSPVFDLSKGDATISYYLWFYHSSGGTQQPLEIEISNNNGATWTIVENVTHNPLWNYFNFELSDYDVTPTDEMQVRFIVSDNPNDNDVEALLDDFRVERLHYSPSLWADSYTLSISQGGVVHFNLDAGDENANRPYLLLGSLSGSDPGYALPDGSVLPLNWDWFTTFVYDNVNTTMFQNFMGYLDSNGCATATFDTLGPLVGDVGEVMTFAFCLNQQPYFVSNPVSVTCVP